MNAPYEFPPRKILVPTDLSAASESALRYARYFHDRLGSDVLVLHAHQLDLPPYFSSGQLDTLKGELKRLERVAEDHVRRQSEPTLGFAPQTEIAEGSPVEAILRTSQKDPIGMILMGMHGYRGLQRLWMGSVTEQVIRRGSLPVLAVRNPPSDAPIGHILCPMNLSGPGRNALDYAAQISKSLKARLTVLHVIEHENEPPDCPLVDEETGKGCSIEEIHHRGNAAKTIAEAAKSLKPDLIVMGAESKSTVMGEFFSSTTISVMQLAIGPLLVVPSGPASSGSLPRDPIQ